MNVDGCLACDVLADRVQVPGGTIAETEHWHADHCIGPFGVGAVVVKAKEHVEALWQMPDAAAAELGPFLRTISGAIVDGLGAERAYLTMWVDKPPLHVHFVLYPRWRRREEARLGRRHGAVGGWTAAAGRVGRGGRAAPRRPPQALTQLC